MYGALILLTYIFFFLATQSEDSISGVEMPALRHYLSSLQHSYNTKAI